MRKILTLVMLILFCLALPAFAKEKAQNKDSEAPKPIAIITVEEMEQQLKTKEISEDLLYIKLKDEQVEVYEGLAKNRSLRKQ